MDERDFLLTYPLYLIVDPRRGHTPLVVVAEDESLRGIAMFTEELLAERVRDAQMPGGEIWKVTRESLETVHLPLFKSWGYSHVGIDTHEHTGQGRYVPIEDLER
jgi:hypothetical protein